MKRFKSILYVSQPGVDQASALARAVSLAERNGARLSIVDVVPQMAADGLGAETVTLRKRDMESMAAPYVRGLNIQFDVLAGTPFLEVIRYVLRNDHELVIKVGEAPSFLPRLFGGDDMHLLRKCPCPVWLMKPTEKTRYNSVIAAVDFDPLERNAAIAELNRKILELAAGLALSDSAPLHLVHAWGAFAERTILLRGASSAEAGAGTEQYIKKEYDLHRDATYALGEELRDWIGKDAYDGLSLSFHLPKGPARTMIATMAARLHADIVVMGTIARMGIPGFIMGNTAEDILNQLSCSVLAVKTPGFVSPVKLEA